MDDKQLIEWIGKQAARRRKLARKERADIAREANMSPRGYADLENGVMKTRGLGVVNLNHVVNALGLTMGEFFSPLRRGKGLAQDDIDRIEHLTEVLAGWSDEADAFRFMIDSMWDRYVAIARQADE